MAAWAWLISLGWVRGIGMLVGAGFAGVLTISLLVNLVGWVQSPPEESVEHAFHRHAKDLKLQSDGPFGTFDRQQLQRGFQVYKEVCAACHGLNLVSFRDLHQLGYNEAEVKAIANQWLIEVPSVNPDTGEAATRKAIPSDRFPNPYANETAARAANNNALPPDLSLMAKAREGGAAYIYSLLTGYANAATYRNEKGEALPAANRPGQGLYFNPYFANLNIAMPPPITADGQVTYAEGNPAPTVDQMAKDVSAFLLWTAEPNMQSRHRSGWAVLIFLIIATILGYLSYRNIWAEAKRKVAPVGPLEPTNKAKRTRASRKAGVAE
jgi:ubiquinol-cytochrome c reductase cytochrome c1 subunit